LITWAKATIVTRHLLSLKKVRFCDYRIVSAKRALGVSGETKFRILACAAIYRHKSADQRGAKIQDEFEYLRGLHDTNLPREDAKDTGLSARWYILWRWWSRK
jgi:hypothetical protein